MRTTVIFSDILFFVGAYAILSLFKINRKLKCLMIIILITSPALVLLDHGHFQYNCIANGLVLLSIYFICLN